MKKIILTLFICFLLVGCYSTKLNSNYDKMMVSNKKINGYLLDLRINGTVNNKSVNEVIRVNNYKNSEYQITRSISKIENETISEDRSISYVKNGKKYIADKKGVYVETKKDIEYDNPNIYLEGLKNIVKINKESNEKIGNDTYKVYDVIFSKSIVTKILTDSALKLNIKDDVKGFVYIDSNGYVYRVVYNNDDISIDASYLDINKSTKINFPYTIR